MQDEMEDINSKLQFSQEVDDNHKITWFLKYDVYMF